MFRSTIVAALLLLVGSVSATSPTEFKITIKNLSYAQVFSPFFVMSHRSSVEPVFTVNEPPSEGLALLAELGDPSLLLDYYKDMSGVRDLFSTGPIPPGAEISFTVNPTQGGPRTLKFISFVSMCVNTNDCFSGVSGIELYDGQVLYLPGYDAGSEFNDESCANVPGPACAGFEGEAPEYQEGEGFVHVHRGIHGIGDLDESVYDWRNPMLKVVVEEM